MRRAGRAVVQLNVFKEPNWVSFFRRVIRASSNQTNNQTTKFMIQNTNCM
jgi:hypothetical protein